MLKERFREAEDGHMFTNLRQTVSEKNVPQRKMSKTLKIHQLRSRISSTDSENQECLCSRDQDEGPNWMMEMFRSSGSSAVKTDMILCWTSLMDSGTSPETSVCQHSSPTVLKLKLDHQRRRDMRTPSRNTRDFSGPKII